MRQSNNPVTERYYYPSIITRQWLASLLGTAGFVRYVRGLTYDLIRDVICHLVLQIRCPDTPSVIVRPEHSIHLQYPQSLSHLLYFHSCSTSLPLSLKMPNMADFSQPLNAAVVDISFSSSVTQKEIRTQGCYTILPIRRHKNLQAFDRSRREMHALWEKHLQDGFVKKHFGTEDAKTGDWCAVAYPMARPDRIRGLSWIFSFFFLVDGA